MYTKFKVIFSLFLMGLCNLICDAIRRKLATHDDDDDDDECHFALRSNL